MKFKVGDKIKLSEEFKKSHRNKFYRGTFTIEHISNTKNEPYPILVEGHCEWPRMISVFSEREVVKISHNILVCNTML